MGQNAWMKLLFETSQREAAAAGTAFTHRPGRLARAFRISGFVTEILEFVDSHSLPRYCWYAGISAQPYSRLSLAHRIRGGDCAKFWDTGSEEVARAVERRLLQLGFDGGTGGGGERSPGFVYVFLQQRQNSEMIRYTR
jgi:hypothetical protein